MLLAGIPRGARLREKMSTETYRHALNTAFKNWHNLAVGAILLGLNVFLVSSANTFIGTSQALQGWATMVIAGYAFIAAIYLGVSPLGENSTLTEAFPGVFDHFRSFIVGGLFYAVGQYFLGQQRILSSDQAIASALSLVIGGALTLVAVLVAVSAAFTRVKSK
jgi:hypothetical protein